jgi:hypothetical protein
MLASYSGYFNVSKQCFTSYFIISSRSSLICHIFHAPWRSHTPRSEVFVKRTSHICSGDKNLNRALQHIFSQCDWGSLLNFRLRFFGIVITILVNLRVPDHVSRSLGPCLSLNHWTSFRDGWWEWCSNRVIQVDWWSEPQGFRDMATFTVRLLTMSDDPCHLWRSMDHHSRLLPISHGP